MILTVISFKGGVGKSVVSQNIAVWLVHNGKDVCILDADPNTNTSKWREQRPDELPSVDVYPLGKMDVVKMINSLESKYDYVIVDCPPAIEQTTSRAVMKSDMSLIPVPTTGGGVLWATEDFLDHLNLLRAKLDVELPSYILANLHEKNVVLHKHILESLKNFQEVYGVRLLDTILPKRVAYGEANTLGKGVLEGDNKRAKEEVSKLVEEIFTIYESL